MGRWAVRDGADELFVVHSLPGGKVSMRIPPGDPLIVTRERAERIRVIIGAAVGSALPRAAFLNAVWMRPTGSKVAHAFAESELSAGPELVDSVAWCGPFPVADLQEDEFAERCTACTSAAPRLP